MKPIIHDVPLIQQGLQDCVQASAAQLLQFYRIDKSIDDIKAEVPVYISKDNQPLGSSIGHIAKYFIDQGFNTTIHTSDIQIFDPSWKKYSNKQLIDHLMKRQTDVKHPTYDQEAFNVIFDGYISFLKFGGQIAFPLIDEKYLVELLQKGPIYTIVSYQFLNQSPKAVFDKDKDEFTNDSIKGNVGTHAVILAGYKDNQFLIIDPDKKFGGKRWFSSSHLIASFYLAQTDYDNLLITLEK